mgnify:CR=1 FL=1
MKYDWIAGTGGIGKGEIFRLVGNSTLGREESRSAILTGYRDYCKLHIVLSYPARILGKKLPVFACGNVGQDERGKELICEMQNMGFCVDYIKETDAPTKYSVCFLYENGDGGNITSCNDACFFVTDKELTEDLEKIISAHGQNGIVLGAPEVPLSVRLGFMREAKKRGCYTVCSVLAEEAEEFIKRKGGEACDLIAVNSDEAAALGKGGDYRAVLRKQNPAISIIETSGKNGCTVDSVTGRIHFDALEADVKSTAGAGDALLGGVITGLALGLPLAVRRDVCAMNIGIIFASFAVESPDTIPAKFEPDAIYARADKSGLKIMI